MWNVMKTRHGVGSPGAIGEGLFLLFSQSALLRAIEQVKLRLLHQR